MQKYSTEDKQEKRGRVIDFNILLLYSPNTLPLGILEELQFCNNQ